MNSVREYYSQQYIENIKPQLIANWNAKLLHAASAPPLLIKERLIISYLLKLEHEVDSMGLQTSSELVN